MITPFRPSKKDTNSLPVFIRGIILISIEKGIKGIHFYFFVVIGISLPDVKDNGHEI